MARRKEQLSNFSATLSEISGLTPKDVEEKLATNLGLPCSSAGLPNHEAIEEVFGFTRNDPYSDMSRKRYQGRPRKSGIKPNAGTHDEYGADVS